MMNEELQEPIKQAIQLKKNELIEVEKSYKTARANYVALKKIICKMEKGYGLLIGIELPKPTPKPVPKKVIK
jgi:hypothetical protein